MPPYGASAAGRRPVGQRQVDARRPALLERLAERGYQFCVVDPEGDYDDAAPAPWSLGDAERAPTVGRGARGAGAARTQRGREPARPAAGGAPGVLRALLPRLQELRARTGRPHWIVVDEAHHLLPRELGRPARRRCRTELTALLLITVHPERVAPAVLADGRRAWSRSATRPTRRCAQFASDAGGAAAAVGDAATLEPGEVLVWQPAQRRAAPVRAAQRAAPRAERRRHVRKYAEGELPPGQAASTSAGPTAKLNLRAQNLRPVPADRPTASTTRPGCTTCASGDYSRWFREAIKDEELADEVAAIERQPDLTPEDSRARVRATVEARYTV